MHTFLGFPSTILFYDIYITVPNCTPTISKFFQNSDQAKGNVSALNMLMLLSQHVLHIVVFVTNLCSFMN